MNFMVELNDSEIATTEKTKTNLKLNKLLVSAFLIIFSHAAMSGAWVPQVGSGYSKIALSEYNADDFFGDDSMSADFSGQNLSYYGEYGFAENFAVYGTLLYQNIEQVIGENDKTKSTGFGDTELGIRYQWQAQPFVLSTSFLVKLPYFYDEEDSLPRGSGETDYELRILLGQSLNKYGYIGLEAGYRLRGGATSDEYRYLFEYGFSVGQNLYLRTKLDTTNSVDKSDNNNNNNNNNLSISPRFDLTKIELTAGWTFDNTKSSRNKWGIEVTYRQDLSGDNTLKGNGIEIGLTKVF